MRASEYHIAFRLKMHILIDHNVFFRFFIDDERESNVCIARNATTDATSDATTSSTCIYAYYNIILNIFTVTKSGNAQRGNESACRSRCSTNSRRTRCVTSWGTDVDSDVCVIRVVDDFDYIYIFRLNFGVQPPSADVTTSTTTTSTSSTATTAATTPMNVPTAAGDIAATNPNMLLNIFQQMAVNSMVCCLYI